MSIFNLEPIEISFGEKDKIFINQSLTFEDAENFTKIGEDNDKLINSLKACIVKIVSDGEEIDISTENLKKLPITVINTVVAEIQKTLSTNDESLKKN